MDSTNPTRDFSVSSTTNFSRAELIDRIQGCIYGAALGDAFGLATEFMSKDQAKHFYGVGPIKFGDAEGFEFWRDRHRGKWNENDFTDDTDQLILILQSLLATSGKLIPTHFAYCIHEWSKLGFPELRKNACGIGFTVGSVFSHPEFIQNPHKAAYDVWNSNGRDLAANGAVMRTSVLGIPFFWDEKQVVQNALNAAKVTHADPRSITSSVIISVIISRLLSGGKVKDDVCGWQDEATKWLLQGTEYESNPEPIPQIFPKPKEKNIEPPTTPTPPNKGFLAKLATVFKKSKPVPLEVTLGFYPFPKHTERDESRATNPAILPKTIPPGVDTFGADSSIMNICLEVVKAYSFLLQGNPLSSTDIDWIQELNSHCFSNSISELKLSESKSIGYTFKCLGAGIYCGTRAKPSDMSPSEFFKTVITELTLEGGDADTNCAVAGALLGCRLGANNLPKDWLSKLRNKGFLDNIIEELCDFVLDSN